jgi:hypothetical protein
VELALSDRTGCGLMDLRMNSRGELSRSALCGWWMAGNSRVLRLEVALSRSAAAVQTRVQLRARDAQRLGHDLHGESSSGNNGNREVGFFHSRP